MAREDRPILIMLAGVALAFAMNAVVASYPNIAELSSGFVTALFASAAGAAAGAYGAQVIVERQRSREEVLREIRATNVAIGLAHDFFTVHFGLKNQYVRLLKERLDARSKEFEEFKRRRAAGLVERNVPFNLGQVDFEVLSPVYVDTAMLGDLNRSTQHTR